jgi:hypothetical protein
MPNLHAVKVHALRPTQITVGMIEVCDKMRELAAMKSHQQHEFLEAHPMPAVQGPEDELYITDHHHLGRALWESGIEHAYVLIEATLSAPGLAQFWKQMVQSHWAHPVNERGERRPYREIPRHVQKLRDDVYRSLAAYVRAAGGFDKTTTPFAEFAWADWLRQRVSVGPGHEDFRPAVEKALKLAHSSAASSLPGYRGEP